jgi:SAM-dependent methyltransferase
MAKNYLRGIGELYGRDNPSRMFSTEIEQLIKLPIGSTVDVLDVGCGPLSSLGLKSECFNINLIGIDPLADQYNKLLDEYKIGVNCSLRSVPGTIENLIKQFPDKRFDVITVFNTLDHTEDPVSGLKQVVQLLKPTGFAYIWCYQNEGVCENYCGLHQWNLTCANNEPILWNPDNKFFIRSIIPSTKINISIKEDRTKPAIHIIIQN